MPAKMAGSTNGLATALSGPPLCAVRTQCGHGEFRDRLQRRPKCLAMRRMPRSRNDGGIDRAVAFLLRGPDLTHRPILVIHALQDGDGDADIGEVFGNIPIPECRVEPGAVPAVEGVVDVLV